MEKSAKDARFFFKTAKMAAIVLFFLIVLSQCVAEKKAHATEEKKEPVISGILVVDSSSSYVDKLSGEKLYKGFVVQPRVTVIAEKIGAYLSVQATKVANGKNFEESSANSVEYSVGVEKEVGILKIDGGYGFSDIKNSEGDMHFLYVVAELPDAIENLTPYVMAEVDIPVKKEILEGGFLYRAGAKYAIKASKQEITFDLSLAGHDGAYGYRPQVLSFGRLTVSTILKAWGLEVKPEINFQKRLGVSTKHGGIAEDRIWFGIQIAMPINFL